MSVRNETYLIYGIRLDDKKCRNNYERLEPLEFPWCGKGAKGTFGILYDGMSSNYVIAGKCVALQDDEGEDSFGCMRIDEKQFQTDISITDWLYANDLIAFIEEDADYGYYLISHYH